MAGWQTMSMKRTTGALLVLFFFFVSHLETAQSKGGGGGTTGSVGSAGVGGAKAGGTAAAVGGSGRTATSASGATGGWSAAGGARTSGGSTLGRTGVGGAAVSTRPRFYGGGGFRGRPILYGAVALWLFYPRGGMSGRTCSNGQFKYGRECRTCSDWDCPIGQFRSTCTPHTDSYCKLCANAPPDADGVSYIYTSPGNNNDCEYRAADPADSFIADGFQADEDASLIMFLEIPTSKAQFNADGTKLSEAIASVAGVGSADKVKFNNVVEYSMDDVNKIDDLASCCSGSVTTCCWERRRSSFAMSAGRTGFATSGDHTGRHLLAANDTTNASTTPTVTASGQCTPVPAADTASRKCDTAACTSVGNVDGTTTDCWANPENYEDYSCQEGYYFMLNGMEMVVDDLLWKQYECCKGGDTFVVVEVQVTTKLGKVDETWTKMNEYDLNLNNANSCLPPVVVTYEAIAGADMRTVGASSMLQNSWTLASSVLVCVLVNLMTRL